MTLAVAYWCVFVAALLPYLWVAIAKTRGERYNNHDPRAWQDKQTNPRSIRFVCLVSCPEGIKNFHDHHPDVPIYTPAVDRGRHCDDRLAKIAILHARRPPKAAGPRIVASMGRGA